MIRNVLAGVAAVALMTGAAYAQDSYSSQSTTMIGQPPAPPANSFSKTTTQRSTDAFGHQTERTDSVEKSQAMTPDGDTTTTTRSHTSTGVAPAPGVPPVQGSTSTTTTIRTNDE